jgi:signal transduction histidine kinase
MSPVSDNGTGIGEDDRPAILRYGFSTKRDRRRVLYTVVRQRL